MSAPVQTGFLANARAVLVLGLPLVGSHVAQFLLHVTDTVMLGWYTVTDLAAGALGATVFFVIFTLGMGFAQAVMPMVATAAAAGDDTEVRRVTRMGIWLSLAFAAVALPLFLLSGSLLAALGQEPDVALVGGGYLSIVGFGLAPALVAMVMKSYLAALGRTQVVLWATIAGVFVNIGVNWLLIFGNLGFPEMGARGAAVASVLVQIVTLVVLMVYAISLPSLKHYQLLVRFWRPDWVALRRVNALGLPIGLALLAETGLFAASAVMMGWLGKNTLAAHSIALEITALFFMVHLGLSNAATVMVGRARGRGDVAALRSGALAAVVLSLGFALATIFVYWIFAEQMVGLFLKPDDPERAAIIPLGVTLLMVAALFQFADSGQVMAMGLLRGIQDTKQPMVIAAVSYWLVGLPCGYGLGFLLGWEGVGIWLGLVMGLTTAALALHVRFWRAV
ncbi:MATE family efflux transporter [Pararhodobacter aggregans]|uniref:MATE family efflux transporter n=1 Tax=Pararhodobacter aggregans TaxID=404875 RepID=UPI000D4FBF98|nr:MATE family efflux transporter [Pararhodobacter aggregans]PTX02845.1 MATE family multidrug resistance protein [Pararhodobacter aggregans]